ncbi:MAG: ATP-dependent DNA ligase [Myxococcota bacterium]
MQLIRLAEASAEVTAASARNAKVKVLSDLLTGLGSEEAMTAVAWLSGELRQGKIGVGYAGVWRALGALPPAPGAATLTVAEVDQGFAAIAALAGPGSAGRRAEALHALLARASAVERGFLGRLLTGEMRQGALDGVVLAALAKAHGAPEPALRKAVMLAGDMAHVAGVLAAEGPAGLARFRLELFRPVLPMLADTAESLAEVEPMLGEVVLEAKLDGARIQVHKDGDQVRVYSRALNEVTAAVPEVVDAARALPARRLVLDGEVIAMAGRAGAERPQPFQTTMRRFGRKLDVAALRAEIPLTPFFFDVLLHDDEDLLATPLAARKERLAALVPAGWRVPTRPTPDLATAQAFMDELLTAGHEGLLVKRLDSLYEAGHRGSSWLKLKPAKSLDLVVLAVEQGSGRRSKWLSNLHLGARDPSAAVDETGGAGGWVMLGKTFKGMTDELLAWQTRELGQREVRREGHVVYVRPELVVEILFQELEVSPRYPGGLALRFARVKGYRPDKRPEEADTIETVRALFRRQAGDSPSGDDSV